MDELIKKNKEVFVTMLNKMLDIFYEESNEKETDSTRLYAKLRRKIIDNEDLTLVELNLLVILITFYTNKLIGINEMNTIAITEFTAIMQSIKAFLNSKNLETKNDE